MLYSYYAKRKHTLCFIPIVRMKAYNSSIPIWRKESWQYAVFLLDKKIPAICCFSIKLKESLQYAVFLIDKRKPTICCIPIGRKENLQYAVFLSYEKKAYNMLYSYWLKRKSTVCCIPIG